MRAGSLFVLGWSIALPIGALAFKRDHHGVLSVAAFQLLQRKDGHREVAPDHIDAFVKGSKFEDHPHQWVPKWFNQHFHRPHWNPPYVRSSCIRRFKALCVELEAAIRAKEPHRAWRNAGKLAHYLQDMNCPPHVVPVWHAGGDAFDQTTLVGNNAIDEDLAREWSAWDLRALLDTISLRTLASVNEPLPLMVKDAIVHRDWSLFWTGPVDDHGFGSYGEVGNAWGQPRLTGGDGCTYEIANAIYQAYYDARWSGACTATAALIIQVQRRLGE